MSVPNRTGLRCVVLTCVPAGGDRAERRLAGAMAREGWRRAPSWPRRSLVECVTATSALLVVGPDFSSRRVLVLEELVSSLEPRLATLTSHSERAGGEQPPPDCHPHDAENDAENGRVHNRRVIGCPRAQGEPMTVSPL